jgi:hypothetical protein
MIKRCKETIQRIILRIRKIKRVIKRKRNKEKRKNACLSHF